MTETGADPDEAAVARIAAGDEAAFRDFVALKLPRLHGFASRMLGDAALADDVAQEAFLRVWRQAGRWQPGRARFDTWLHRVVINLCTDRLRRRSRDAPETELDGHPDPAPDPEAALLGGDRVAALRRAMDRLPPRQKQALLLQVHAELPVERVAEALGLGVEATESLLARARRSLRILLAEVSA